MKRCIAFLAMIFFMWGCASNPSNTASAADVNDTTNVKTVTIRSGNNKTVYKVNTSNLVTESAYTNSYGATNTRSYSYDANKELQSIVKNNSVSGTESVSFSTVKNRSTNQVTKKIKTISNSRGASSSYTIEYFYDGNGKVIGMIQTDGNRNIIAKGVNN